jgi:hypothetical protein
MTPDNNQSAGRRILMKALFIVGILVAILVLGFALIYIVPRIVNGIGNAASAITSVIRGTKESITVTSSDAAVKSGEPFTISWTDEEEVATTGFSIFYECADGLTVEFNGEAAACGEAVDASFDNNEADVEAILADDDSFADVQITVSAIESDKVVRTGSITVTVHTDGNEDVDDNANGSVDRTDVSTSTKPSSTKPSTGGTSVVTTPRATGPADLHVGGIETGVVRGGQFYAASDIDSDELAAIRFNVTNVGGRSTGSWSFNYSEPVSPASVKSSGSQPSMAAGQTFQYVITFSGHVSGRATVSVYADPNNAVSEGSESNNQASATFDFDGSTGSNGSNGGYDSDADADLKVQVIDTGRLDGNRFVADNSVDSDDTVALQFRVTNAGGESTGTWRFEVKMTGDDSQTYRSSRQPSLAPGQSMVLAIGFDGISDDADEIELEVIVDSEDDVDEESESNNEDSEEIELDN